MKIYKVTFYNYKGERVEYLNHFTSFKQAKTRISWQCSANGLVTPKSWPKKPRSFTFTSDKYTVKLTVLVCNETYANTLGSWIGNSLMGDPKHERLPVRN